VTLNQHLENTNVLQPCCICNTYLFALASLFKASREMTWPQTSFIGGLFSVLCCLSIGQAKTEW